MGAWLDVKRWRRDRLGRRSRLAGGSPSSSDGRALLELSRAATHDWSASIRQLVQFETGALDVERVNFWTLSDEPSSIRCEAGYVASTRSFEHGAAIFEPDAPEYFTAMREARVLRITDVTTDARCRGLLEYCALRGVSSMLDIPVWVEGRLAGVLCHEHVGPTRSWTQAEEEFAIGAAQISSAALAARAHTRAETAARRAVFLDTVSRVLATSLDERDVADRALSLVVSKLAEAAGIWVLNRDGVLEFLTATHADPQKRDLVVELARGASQPMASIGMVSRVAYQRQSLLVAALDASAAARYGLTEALRSALASLDLRSAMCVPLAIGSKTLGALLFFTTRRPYSEEDLELAEEVGERVASALENARLYAVAREAIRARDDFLVLASHELRTPLTALMLSSDDALRRAQRSGDPAEEKRCNTIAHQVRRLGSLVERMLEAVQTRADGIVLTRQACDLASVVDRTVTNVAERAKRAGCRLVVRTKSQATGYWDCPRLERAIRELLENSIKFGAGKPIDIVLDRDGPQAVLTVHDRGPGIPVERFQSIFSPFERAVPKEHFGGLGLGLYIAREIVIAHGGTISATNHSPGGGATFVVRLPLAVRSATLGSDGARRDGGD
jgi:signal transduction histidine kinase